MTDPIHPGLLVLHGNRLEDLAATVFAWLGSRPLAPLEDEVFLVQSNGMAEWLKMQLASAHGVCAATRVELPARFIWRAYRAALGPAAVPRLALLDKLSLAWRFMRLLPGLAGQPGFEPVAGFLGRGDPGRRLQLAQRLADLFDQYQVYRGDWLADWAAGADRLRSTLPDAGGSSVPVPPGQHWQPALWRALRATLSPDEQQATRSELHRRFLRALQPDAPAAPMPALPRRVVLFGTTHIPLQTLEAVAALAQRSQVILAVPNPCRHQWADIIDGRELLRAARRRQAWRGGVDLSQLALQDLHAHGHPLLAAWGRQSRDFVRLLDAFDDVQAARQRFEIPRVDLFDDAPGHSLLEQVQAAVRDLTPLPEHTQPAIGADDRSIVFHVAHGPHREVEVLHDQLLQLLAQSGAQGPLHPRDIVVMVPAIDTFAPAIRAVFGQHERGQPRHIPWGIADLKDRGRQPILVALEWLLRAPQQRFNASELRDLLDVPALARRFGIGDEELPTLLDWVEAAGIRWGLNAAQRDSLGLAAGGEQNTWAFGLRRVLLGYATGALEQADGFQGIEPFAEVAGLSAPLAGVLADLVQALQAWWNESRQSRSPVAWAQGLRELLARFFSAVDDDDRAMLSALDDALTRWLQACEVAGFDDALELEVVREAWLGAVDDPESARRFRAGGVTFCTLLPLRAIPFEVVCLLGMNDGDFPRRSTRSDFDLMALPGQARPGDRSGRDDDRQLMLDALLSARRVLYVSWAGRSQRDNQEQPPSVLVAQLRDYLAAGWGSQVLAPRTTEHPLQPFSRRYFEARAGNAPAGGLFTYAGEWRAAHVDASAQGAPVAAVAAVAAIAAVGSPAVADSPALTLTVTGLAGFLRNPVKAFFNRRLQVSFDEADAAAPDHEPFTTGGLDRWALLAAVLRESRRQLDGAAPASAAAGPDVALVVRAQLARLQRAGRLPIAGPGRRVQADLEQTLLPMVARWQAARDEHPHHHDKQPLRWPHPDRAALVFDDWLSGLRSVDASASPVWIDLQASKIADAGGRSGPTVRADKLLPAWVRCLAAAACGHAVQGLVIGVGAVVHVQPPPPDEARDVLAALLDACHAGLSAERPWPTAVQTGLAYLRDPGSARQVYEGSGFSPVPGEGREACLARLYPDFATLLAQPGFEAATRVLYGPLLAWIDSHVHVELLSDAGPGEVGSDAGAAHV